MTGKKQALANRKSPVRKFGSTFSKAVVLFVNEKYYYSVRLELVNAAS